MLLLIPVVTIPLMAVFGVPEIIPQVPSAMEGWLKPASQKQPPASSEAATPAADTLPLPRATLSEQAIAWEQRPTHDIALPRPLSEQAALPSEAAASQGRSLFDPPPTTADMQNHPSTEETTNLTPINYTRSTPRNRPPAAATRPAVNLTWQQAVKRLNELEIRNFRLEPGLKPDQFMFVCSYTPPDNPRVSYRFEAEADEPLRAVAKVLEQIETWVSSR